MERTTTWLPGFSSLLAVGMFLGAGLLFTTPAAAGNSKVVICHIPPGDPENAHTITVSEKAVQAHLKHGDWLGECASGCNNDDECDDENLCTDDKCLPDGTCSHVSVDCDDSNVCTDDVCDDPTVGCEYTPVSVSTDCDDENVCTSGDTCDAGICTGTDVPGCCLDAPECDDADWCTHDSCVDNVCRYLAEDCSTTDLCSVGVCDSLASECVYAPVSCDDLDVCTDDFCDSVNGCYTVPTSEPPEPDEELTCDDGVDNDCDGPVDSEDDDCTLSCVPTPEVCDYADNDCDGEVDEHFRVGNGCAAGLGECEMLGTWRCSVDGTSECSVVAGNAPEETEVTCDDGIDNDCDGLVDQVDGDCSDVVCNTEYPGLVYGGYDYAGTAPDDDLFSLLVYEVLIPACKQDATDKGCPQPDCPCVPPHCGSCLPSLGEACKDPLLEACRSCAMEGVACLYCRTLRQRALNSPYQQHYPSGWPVPEAVCDEPIILDVCRCVATETDEVSCNDGIDNDCDGRMDLYDENCGHCDVLPEGGVCRPSNGACDAPEVCDGIRSSCGPDEMAGTEVVCREKSHRDCDALDFCDGSSRHCPEDMFAAAGTPCGSPAEGTCNGFGECSTSCAGGPPGLVLNGVDFKGVGYLLLDVAIHACVQEAEAQGCLNAFSACEAALGGANCQSCLDGDDAGCIGCAIGLEFTVPISASSQCDSFTVPDCQCQTEAEVCDDGIDNDCDGRVDGYDSDCGWECEPSLVEATHRGTTTVAEVACGEALEVATGVLDTCYVLPFGDLLTINYAMGCERDSYGVLHATLTTAPAGCGQDEFYRRRSEDTTSCATMESDPFLGDGIDGFVCCEIEVGCNDGRDNDCDGFDGLASGGNDCDDTRADINPGVTEGIVEPSSDPSVGFDANCDGTVEIDPQSPVEECSSGAGCGSWVYGLCSQYACDPGWCTPECWLSDIGPDSCGTTKQHDNLCWTTSPFCPATPIGGSPNASRVYCY